MFEEDLDEIYDWTADVMNDKWAAAKARRRIRKQPERSVSDVLLDQEFLQV